MHKDWALVGYVPLFAGDDPHLTEVVLNRGSATADAPVEATPSALSRARLVSTLETATDFGPSDADGYQYAPDAAGPWTAAPALDSKFRPGWETGDRFSPFSREALL